LKLGKPDLNRCAALPKLGERAKIPSMAAVALNGSGLPLGPLPAPPQPGQDPTTFIDQYERSARALSGLLPTLDIQEHAEANCRQLRAFARVLRAAITYIVELDGLAFKLSEDQRERLAATDDELDELIDTLDWATDKKSALLNVMADADRTR
jgi:hypothetical protein